jgi:uncharacterized protein (DUF2141 family)
MKSIIMLCAIAWIASAAMGQTKLTVTIENIKGDKGSIRIGIFDKEESFLKKAIDGKVIKANNESVTVVFDKLKPGTYAISVIHDENENTELDTKAFGMPAEGIGFSNNVMGKFGPPSFEKSSFSVSDEKALHIKLKYM